METLYTVFVGCVTLAGMMVIFELIDKLGFLVLRYSVLHGPPWNPTVHVFTYPTLELFCLIGLVFGYLFQVLPVLLSIFAFWAFISYLVTALVFRKSDYKDKRIFAVSHKILWLVPKLCVVYAFFSTVLAVITALKPVIAN